jgi:ribokinase
MQAAGKPVMFDAGRTSEKQLSGENIDLVRHTDYLISGSGFLQALTGIDDVLEAGRKALEMGPWVVVQTEGEQGSITITREDSFHTPAFPVDVVDTTGAGDVFHGAYLYGIRQGWNLRRIARFSAAAAALECTALGGRIAMPTLTAVEQFLSGQEAEGGSAFR